MALPDGKSLIASVGLQRSTIWLHQRYGERQISGEAFAYLPSFSADGKKLFYIAQPAAASSGFNLPSGGGLWSVALDTGGKEHLLPDILVYAYAVSPNGKELVFQTNDQSGHRIWRWAIDRRSAPQPLASQARNPRFDYAGDVFFEHGTGQNLEIFRIKSAEAEMQRVMSHVNHLVNVSPDGNWIVTSNATGDVQKPGSIVAHPLQGGPEKLLCGHCLTWSADIHVTDLSWSPDQRFLYLPFQGDRELVDKKLAGKTLVLPLPSGKAFPTFSGDLINNPALTQIPGSRVLDNQDVVPGPDPSIYAFLRIHAQRNIYQISLQ